MILIPGSLSFAKLVMMSSAPAKSAGDARYVSQDPFIAPDDLNSKSNLGVHSFYVKCNQRTNSPILSQYFSYKSTREKEFKYQEN